MATVGLPQLFGRPCIPVLCSIQKLGGTKCYMFGENASAPNPYVQCSVEPEASGERTRPPELSSSFPGVIG